MQSLNLRCISLKHIYPSLLQDQASLPEASGKLLLTHPGFFKQRMQSRHFQYFNVISQKKKTRKEILCIRTDSCVNRSLSVFVRSWPRGQMAGDSCALVKRHEGLVLKQNACMWCVLCRFLVRWEPVYVCWVCGSSVQGQQWLGVLAFPLVLVFQRAGLHHGLGPESKNTHMLTETAAEALTFLESFCLISCFCFCPFSPLYFFISFLWNT